MDAKHLREYIVRPALKAIEMHSAAAENLVMGTAAQESLLKWVKQLGGGPALGIFQMEPFTHDDIWATYLISRGELQHKVLSAISTSVPPPSDRLMWDFRYAAIMCRLRYRRVRDPLPDEHDVHAMAAYWKRFYNTAAGKGTVEEFVDRYRFVQ